MSVPFAKYEGLGNDFVLVEAGAVSVARLDDRWVRAVCDRRRGIGADGVLWLSIDRETRRTRMAVFNADGSRPEMCGNGARCVGAFLLHEGVVGEGRTVDLLTDAGVRALTVVSSDGAGECTVRVGMGPVHVRDAVVVDGVSVVPVSVGNPHAVVSAPVPSAAVDALLRALRARVDVWPEGVNVEFVETLPDGYRVRVHERGVGWTEACGTGACAVAAAMASPSVSETTVDLDGGRLHVTLHRDTPTLTADIVGPARRVFSGTLNPADVR